MNFLKHIKSYKQSEIKQLRLKQRKNRFMHVLQENNHILIAEIKIKSPSSGILLKSDPILLALQYEKNQVNAISVVTDAPSFGGSLELLKNIRQRSYLPLLRKDFIMDTTQLVESLFYGADAVLLVAKLLSSKELKKLICFSYDLGLLPIVEIAHKKEIAKVIKAGATVVGVNSRDLTTFKVNFENALELIKLLPKSVISLLFSGIRTNVDIKHAYENGARGVLVGTSLLKATDISVKIKEFKL